MLAPADLGALLWDVVLEASCWADVPWPALFDRCPWSVSVALLLVNSLVRARTGHRERPTVNADRGHAPMRPRRECVRGCEKPLVIFSHIGQAQHAEVRGGGAPSGAPAFCPRGMFACANCRRAASLMRTLRLSALHRGCARVRSGRSLGSGPRFAGGICASLSASSSRPARSGQAGGAPEPPECPADEPDPQAPHPAPPSERHRSTPLREQD